jgi:4-amino-4-deoxychorismate lyase
MNGLREVYEGGVLTAADWSQDRGLHYGDGLFETIIVRAGRLRFEALHKARLWRGCERLGIDLDHNSIWQQAAALAAKHGAVILKILVTRGSAISRGYAPHGSERARWLMFVYDAPRASDLPERVTAISLPARLGENARLAGIKHCNRLEQVLARQEVQRQGSFEGLLGSSSGRLISGTMSNVFIEQDSCLLTPVLDNCGIAGVMRQVVLREAPLLGFSVRVADIPFGQLQTCSAAFVTNVRLGVLALHTIDNRPLTVSDAVVQLAAKVSALDH